MTFQHKTALLSVITLCQDNGFHPSELRPYLKKMCRTDWKGLSADGLQLDAQRFLSRQGAYL
jgi:hypothetical protein